LSRKRGNNAGSHAAQPGEIKEGSSLVGNFSMFDSTNSSVILNCSLIKHVLHKLSDHDKGRWLQFETWAQEENATLLNT
jgi:hypothetical protein